ncbi:LOW QUALITY PROTEIN: hypothetical protein N5P37_009013 [Trichoderma harzianum]|nr:LOW QUALITY PROTEIN: hypothetical protein N5P37_009013 [Trichoderma harzianum]
MGVVGMRFAEPGSGWGPGHSLYKQGKSGCLSASEWCGEGGGSINQSQSINQSISTRPHGRTSAHARTRTPSVLQLSTSGMRSHAIMSHIGHCQAVIRHECVLVGTYMLRTVYTKIVTALISKQEEGISFAGRTQIETQKQSRDKSNGTHTHTVNTMGWDTQDSYAATVRAMYLWSC